VTQARGLSGLLRRNSQTSRGHGLLTPGARRTARNRPLPGQDRRAGISPRSRKMAHWPHGSSCRNMTR
jgi:hypothetical protein